MIKALIDFFVLSFDKYALKRSETMKRLQNFILLVTILMIIYVLLIINNLWLIAIPFVIFAIFFSASFGTWYLREYNKDALKS